MNQEFPPNAACEMNAGHRWNIVIRLGRAGKMVSPRRAGVKSIPRAPIPADSREVRLGEEGSKKIQNRVANNAEAGKQI